MIRHRIDIEQYGWTAWLCLDVDASSVSEVLQMLQDIGCSQERMEQASNNLMSGNNNALTYSNMDAGQSVIAIGSATSAQQFFNSLVHELHHIVAHICEARDIDYNSEVAAYLCGDIALQVYPKAAQFLCERCSVEQHTFRRIFLL